MKVKVPAALGWVAAVLVVLGLLFASLGPSRLGLVGRGLFLAVLLLLLSWVLSPLIRRLAWRVSGRLALTYFLMGVLPIPLVVSLLFAASYLLSGFFLGHLYRDSVTALHQELTTAAESQLAAAGHRIPPLPGFAFGYYEDGLRLEGDPRTPPTWPRWLAEAQGDGENASYRRAVPAPLVALADGSQTVAVALEKDGLGIVAFFDDDLEDELSRRSDVGIELIRADDPRNNPIIDLDLLGVPFVLQLPRRGASALLIVGSEISGNLRALGDGTVLSPRVSATLTATPGVVFRHLFSSSREIDTVAWGTFFFFTFLLLDIYGLALFLAVRMIVGLSRAVNRLSQATSALQAGDFATRIAVRRRDQVGALQTSFNQLAENLEKLVVTAAQKEVLEKELEIARQLQQSLLPNEVVQGDGVEFATFFEPSAALGGDYFDIFRLDDDRLAVVIADVAGHGLPAGLRMAMIKAALLILVEENRDPQDILTRLDGLIRNRRDHSTAFVTATLSLLDLESGRLEVTNAGHPPTYVLRNGDVEEVLLPSSPLGALGHAYGTRTLALNAGDTVVWLSDGFVEAANLEGEPFGYEQTMRALEGETTRATAVRDRLLQAVKDHTLKQPAEDDRTLVVMRYQPSSSPSSA